MSPLVLAIPFAMISMNAYSQPIVSWCGGEVCGTFAVHLKLILPSFSPVRRPKPRRSAPHRDRRRGFRLIGKPVQSWHFGDTLEPVAHCGHTRLAAPAARSSNLPRESRSPAAAGTEGSRQWMRPAGPFPLLGTARLRPPGSVGAVAAADRRRFACGGRGLAARPVRPGGTADSPTVWHTLVPPSIVPESTSARAGVNQRVKPPGAKHTDDLYCSSWLLRLPGYATTNRRRGTPLYADGGGLAVGDAVLARSFRRGEEAGDNPTCR